jgi:hypothetical protein
MNAGLGGGGGAGGAIEQGVDGPELLGSQVRHWITFGCTIAGEREKTGAGKARIGGKALGGKG